MNPRPDMLDVEGDKRLGRLRQSAVFATVLGTLPDKTSRGGIH